MSYQRYIAFSFGSLKTGLSTVGYRLYDSAGAPVGARTTTGVSERAPGVYAVTATFPDGFIGEARGDTGEGTPKYATLLVTPEEWEDVGLLMDLFSSGDGAFAVTITVTDGVDPLQNARVRVTEGINSFSAHTDINGVASFNLNAATYALGITKSGYQFTPSTIAVAAAANFNAEMDEIVVPAPTDPDLCSCYLATRDGHGDAEGLVSIFFRLVTAPTPDSYMTGQFKAISDQDGSLVVELRRLAKYQAKRAPEFSLKKTDGWRGAVEFTVPDSGSFELPQVLGDP